MDQIIMMVNKSNKMPNIRNRLIKDIPNPFLSWNKNNDNTSVPLKIKSPSNMKFSSSKKKKLKYIPELEDQKVEQKKNNNSFKLLISHKENSIRLQRKKSLIKGHSNINNILPKINSNNSSVDKSCENKRKSFSYFNFINNNNNNIMTNRISNKKNSFDKRVAKEYFALSKAGKDSSGNTKTNQDSYLVLTRINKLTNFNVFAIFDGHGPDGHLVSQFLVKYFKDFFNNNKEIKKCRNESDIFNLLLHENYRLLRDIIISSEEKLKEQENINIECSGSTCCMIIQINQKLICVNVGDSRAILFSEIIKEEIINLSFDHKPNLKKELERIKHYGGVVEKCLYEDGTRDGPFRVWNSSKQEYPGLAVSRSIGDLEASKLGVIPEPDFCLKTIKSNMKYIIIASDGIWEFLSNKYACDIVKKFYNLRDPKGAAEELVKKGREEWARDGDNADDITVITIFF